MKKLKVEHLVNKDILDKLELSDEFLFRELARKVIVDMDFEDLQKIMSFTKTDPYSEESKNILLYSTDRYVTELIKRLMNNKTVLFEANMNI